MSVSVQTADFDVSHELAIIRAGRADIGAVACFVGLVRDLNQGDQVSAMTLEHYAGMTEKALQQIVEQAEQRWQIQAVRIIHRVGELKPSDQIVLVAAASAHRQEAFAACAFMMDYLKTDAPFWKKEQTPTGARWVDARETDTQAKAKWQE